MENIIELFAKVLEKQQKNQETIMNSMLETFGQQMLYSLGAKEQALPRASLPEFHGLPTEDINSWIFLLEHYFRGHNVAEAKQTIFAGSFLRSSALQWYRRTLSERESGMYSFKTSKMDFALCSSPEITSNSFEESLIN